MVAFWGPYHHVLGSSSIDRFLGGRLAVINNAAMYVVLDLAHV